ncbi:sigma factor binding protein 2, chloroplastic-like [Solanum dulcamara]|uniref:sigma factor binding protein 2, chloroplastic-like n=1 Tax=Solanum dulcamara TaxID=45834 RepID=UPI0024863DC7|nr:sigma factor binding protein 2, chloroplastic-like [Solanum dulcamara]
MMMKYKNNKKQTRRDDHNSKKSNIKVVYISTPMKVKTSASRFRSLVQELTGRNSDIERIMETHGSITEFEDIHGERDDVNELPAKSSSLSPSPSSSSISLLPAKSSISSPISSESNNYFMEPNFDDLFNNQLMGEQFLALLASSNYNMPPSSSDYSAEIDVLGSYDALL